MKIRFLYFSLPLIALIVIPAIILFIFGAAPVNWHKGQTYVAFFLALPGFAILFQTFYLFATIGNGTCSPLAPPQKLVICGPYAYIRHPMIFSGMLILLAELLLFPSAALMLWFAICLLFNLWYLPMQEEPALQRRFGAEYNEYCRQVPRYCPRLRPWRPETNKKPRT
ncbi:MAG: isoprenylcysteine carboxylmethyltransferase family protein [Lentisphaeria bacterium]